MKKLFNLKNILAFILLFILLGTVPSLVYATDGFAIGVGGNQWIDLHGYNRHVFNLSLTHSIFVPTRTSEEWRSFRIHTPLHVRVLSDWSACSEPCGGGTQTRSCSGNCTGVLDSQSCNTHACTPAPAPAPPEPDPTPSPVTCIPGHHCGYTACTSMGWPPCWNPGNNHSCYRALFYNSACECTVTGWLMTC